MEVVHRFLHISERPPSTVAPTLYRSATTGNSYKGLDGIQEQASVSSKVGLPQLHSHEGFLHDYAIGVVR